PPPSSRPDNFVLPSRVRATEPLRAGVFSRRSSSVSLMQSLRALFGVPATRRFGKPQPRTAPRFRPTLEGLEDRTVPSATAALAVPTLGPALAAPAPHQISSVFPISITNIAVQNGQLVAQGLLGSTPFSAPITLSATPSGDTPILHLRIDAIHLDLLG